jgi:hypothetical protein
VPESPKGPSTAPPPFDPEDYARKSDAAVRVASDFKLTAELPAPPPLNKRVRLAVPESDLAWFDLSAEAVAIIRQIDGTKTLLELMEAHPSPERLRAFAELEENRILAFDDDKPGP